MFSFDLFMVGAKGKEKWTDLTDSCLYEKISNNNWPTFQCVMSLILRHFIQIVVNKLKKFTWAQYQKVWSIKKIIFLQRCPPLPFADQQIPKTYFLSAKHRETKGSWGISTNFNEWRRHPCSALGSRYTRFRCKAFQKNLHSLAHVWVQRKNCSDTRQKTVDINQAGAWTHHSNICSSTDENFK